MSQPSMAPLHTLTHPALLGADPRVRDAMAFLRNHLQDQPNLEDLAAHVGLSPHHLQKRFTQELGISPKQFLQSLTLAHAKTLLRKPRSTLQTSLDVGLSGTGRLHDLFITYEAMTPGTYKNRGQGLVVRYGTLPTLFGEALVLLTELGLCGFDFISTSDRDLLARYQQNWPAARFEPISNDALTALTTQLRGEGEPVRLLLLGSAFQVAVWQALLRVPAGTLSTYREIAIAAGYPGAERATGSMAIGRNPIALFVPCHRIIRTGGGLGGYASGTARKRLMLGFETLAYPAPAR
ncbi:MAG: methylated-DNA--[protein]-cysteine S-methyltransferase [Pseudomonadota bacterium]